MIRESVAQEIRRDHPDWSSEAFICRDDLNRYRNRHIQSLLEAEKGELTALEQEVLDSLTRQDILSSNIEEQLERKLSFGERLADRIADIGGSWFFILSFAGFLLLWIFLNSVVLLKRPFDPYPSSCSTSSSPVLPPSKLPLS